MTRPLFDVFRQSMLNNSEGSRKEIQEVFVKEMLSDPVYTEMLARDYFDRMAAVHMVRKERLGVSFGRTDVSADKIERTRATVVGKERAQTVFGDMKRAVSNVVLLDLELPDGKKLRNATGAECVKAGGFYAAVAKSLAPTQVVDRHLTETDLHNIRLRFYKENRESA